MANQGSQYKFLARVQAHSKVLAVIQFLVIQSLQIFAHATTAYLLWYEQKLVVINTLHVVLVQDNISMKLNH